MESKLLELGYLTPTNKTFNKDTIFDPTSPTDSSTSVKRLQRKPDTTRRKNSSRGKKDSLTSVFAGFYSPKQFNRKDIETSEIIASNILKDTSILTMRENTETYQNKQSTLAQYKANALKRSSMRQYERVSEKENEQKHNNQQLEAVSAKSKKFQQQVKKLQANNDELQQKIHQLTSQVKDLQKLLINKQSDIKQYQARQKNYQSQLLKLRQQNIVLQEQSRDQQNELDLLDRKYLQVQIQIRDLKRNKDSKKKDNQDFTQKILALEEIIKQKNQQLHKMIAHNEKISCKMWTKEQRLHQLQNNLTFKKDALLEHTNKKLRMVNKELMHRVNSLLSSSPHESQDVLFQLSPQK